MKIVKIKDVSQFLDVKVSTIYSWAEKGSIPSHKLNGLWRFDMEEIEQWIKLAKPLYNHSQKTTKKLNKGQNQDINRLVKKAIDDIKGRGYNSTNGKSGHSQGLGKEEKGNGTL